MQIEYFYIKYLATDDLEDLAQFWKKLQPREEKDVQLDFFKSKHSALK